MDPQEYLNLMDRLDDLFVAVHKHDRDIPSWLRPELRDVKACYDRINAALEVDQDVTQ